MLLDLKIALIRNGKPQYRVAADLGLDPSKLSRIVREIVSPSDSEREALAEYLGLPQADLFGGFEGGEADGSPREGT